MRRISEAAKRATVRRERENDAQRLLEVVPELHSLTLEIDERRQGEPEPDVSHIRRIVVDHAPALFDLPCYDRHCDGGHDITGMVLRALKGKEERFEGSDRCDGNTRDGNCPLELRYVAVASYD